VSFLIGKTTLYAKTDLRALGTTAIGINVFSPTLKVLTLSS